MAWPPLEQDWTEESTVRRVASFATPLTSDYPKSEPEHQETRRKILTQAQTHIHLALVELEEAVAWFTIIDSKDQSDLVRRVEAFRDTIDYRASL